MKVVRHLEETTWRHFVDEHPDGKIFHTLEMFQVFAQIKGHRPTLWAVIDANGDVLALLLPVEITLKGGVLRGLTTRVVVYGSVLYTPGPVGQDALGILFRTYTQEVDRRVLFTELRNLSDLSDAQSILTGHGFVYEDHLNYLVNLGRSEEGIMQSMSRGTRKKIRRGLRRGQVTIEEANRPEQVGTCYELLDKTYARARVPLAARSLFEAAFEVLHSRGMVKFLLARVDNTYVATSVELIYKDVIYGWYGGMDREYGEYLPNELLTWYILSWGAKNGYRMYDFGGAGKPDEEYGVRDFKAKFGGELVNYGRNIQVHAPIRFAVSKLGFQAYRHLSELRATFSRNE
jgi:serine/alanine adding enzyme